MQTAVARCDSLSVFMREMEKHPLLSKEEEYTLAVRYYENGILKRPTNLWSRTSGSWLRSLLNTDPTVFR